MSTALQGEKNGKFRPLRRRLNFCALTMNCITQDVDGLNSRGMSNMLVRIAVIALLMAMTTATAAREPSDAVSVTSAFQAGATSHPANPAPPDISIQVAAPKEVEFRDESRDDNGKPRQIILDLIGQATDRAVAYANFRIEQAIDDAGEDLADSDDPVLSSNTHIKKTEQHRRFNGIPFIRVRALFRAPSRHATKFVRFKGQVQVMTLSDESRSVVIPTLGSYIAHRPNVKALHKENLGLDVHTNGTDFKYVYVRIYGNPVIVRKVRIIDENGPASRGWPHRRRLRHDEFKAIFP